MRHNGSDPPIHVLFPEGQNPSGGFSPRTIRAALVLLTLFLLIFVLFHNGIPLYTDWLWYRSIHDTGVFSTVVLAKTGLFALSALLFAAILGSSIITALRMAPGHLTESLRDRLGDELAELLQRRLGLILLIATLLLSLWAGRFASDNWADWLLFLHPASFHQTDPVFHNDISFYVFQMPFLEFVSSFLTLTLLITFAVSAGLHLLAHASDQGFSLRQLPSGVKKHLLLLAALGALLFAFGTRLSAYDLLQNNNGIFSGPGYVDLHVTLPALNLQVLLLAAAALGCIAAMFTGSLRLPILCAAAWLVTVIVGGSILPPAVQQLIVNPNQLAKETPYIRENIAYTRMAYQLNHVTVVNNFPASTNLTAADLNKNQDTLDNIRLWDHHYLGKVYEQLQTIKPYYRFQQANLDGSFSNNIDIDRYQLQGRIREVMLAPREMNTSGLPATARTWQNMRLSYTHGYGLVMSPVSRVISGGPEMYVQDFPPAANGTAASLKITRPQMYFGTLSGGPVYVDTQQKEFDYPSTTATNGGQDHYSSYHGSYGVNIGSSWMRRIAYALVLGDVNLILADNLTSHTQVLYRRDIRHRLQLAAPFLQQDTDPYLVVNQDSGHLDWIVDCYTLSDRYPYSASHNIAVGSGAYEAPNYLRNSVKAVIDAYTGQVRLYLTDPSDPIIQAWSRIFPGLLHPLSQMPAGLQAHLRYPENLFRVQRAIYATYHVHDPRVFYLKEDAWAVPTEPSSDPNAPEASMSPYYVVMHLPDLSGAAASERNTGAEFVIMSPMSPINKEEQNILGWMCGRCDAPHYGQLVLYRFPQQASVLGPAQIVQRINSDKVISPQLSLLRSGGSSASLGNMLVIPVERSLLYIAPLYVEATNTTGQLPKLVKVIVAYGDREVMTDTLQEALAQLFPGYGGSAAPAGAAAPSGAPAVSAVSLPAGSVPQKLRALIQQASDEYQQAQAKLKQGDFAGYGAATKALSSTLQQLQGIAGSH